MIIADNLKEKKGHRISLLLFDSIMLAQSLRNWRGQNWIMQWSTFYSSMYTESAYETEKEYAIFLKEDLQPELVMTCLILYCLFFVLTQQYEIKYQK